MYVYDWGGTSVCSRRGVVVTFQWMVTVMKQSVIGWQFTSGRGQFLRYSSDSGEPQASVAIHTM